MEHAKKSQNVVTGYGILPILPLEFKFNLVGGL